MAEDRAEQIVDTVSKSVGKGLLKLLSKGFERQPTNPFGLPSLDHALNGGLMHGTMVELFGGEGGGKTTLALTIMGNILKNGKNTAIVLDAEQKLDHMLAKNLGVDLSVIPFGQPSSAEEAFKVIEAALDNMSPGDMVLVDSIAALVPEAQIEKGIGAQHYAGNSMAISNGINLLRNKISKSGVIVVFINQIREKLGVVYGSNLTTPGGHGLKHACETRIEVNKGSLIKDGDKNVGQEVNARIIKSAHCAPYNTTNLSLYFGEGFCKLKSTLDLAKAQGIISQTGGWIMFEGQKYHGEKAFFEFMETSEGVKLLTEKLKI